MFAKLIMNITKKHIVYCIILISFLYGFLLYFFSLKFFSLKVLISHHQSVKGRKKLLKAVKLIYSSNKHISIKWWHTNQIQMDGQQTKLYIYIEIASCLQTFRVDKNCLNYLGGYKWGPPPPSKVGKEGGTEHGILPFDRVECQ